MKKILLCLFIWAVILTAVPAKPSVVAAPAISTNAETAALIDVASGRILYSQKGDKQVRIASLTKIMTAIVAIENGKLSDLVKVSGRAFGKEGSSIYLKLGEEMSLHNMLYGLMLRSGNDAATAIAEHVGGSEEGFVYLMNQKAEQLGLVNSHFMNPHGLDVEGHYSSANDLAKLTAYALKNPVFKEIVKTETKKAPNPNESWDYTWFNKNKMLGLYEGADGVKTGYTKLAKRCLVSSATRGGQQLAAVTINDGQDWADHTKLLNYGFANYRLQMLVEKGESVGQGLVAGKTVSYPMDGAESEQITRKIELEEAGTLNYRLGIVGKLKITVAGEEAGVVPLYADGDVRLGSENKSAWGFRTGESGMKTANKYLDTLRDVFRTLVTGKAR